MTAVLTLPSSHDVDKHATDLVGINDITRVLLVYTCQQGVCPPGLVLPIDNMRITLYNNVPQLADRAKASLHT
jgi:hypothetical protein